MSIVWRTSDGVMHTVALPDLSALFTAQALAALLSVLADLDKEHRDAVVEDLTLDTTAHWNEVAVDEAVEQAFFARPASAMLFDTPSPTRRP